MKDNKDKNQEIWRRNRERNGNLKGNEALLLRLDFYD
jgi:hypothetical protein